MRWSRIAFPLVLLASSLSAAQSTVLQQAYIKASNTDSGDFFAGVAVWGDTLAVAAQGEDSGATGIDGDEDDDSAPDSGAVYVFVRDGESWVQQAYIKASNAEAGDRFGSAIALWGDTLVVGANNEDGSASGVNGDHDNGLDRAGAAYVFVRNGTTWSQQAYLKASNPGQRDFFGTGVAVYEDTVAVGAIWEDGVNFMEGAVYVFVRNGTTWGQQAYIKASNAGTDDSFGGRLSLCGDTLAVGVPGEDSSAVGINGNGADNSAPLAGAAYVFTREDETWSQQVYIKASNTGTADQFGASVAVWEDTLIVGAAREASSAPGVGGNQADNSLFGAGAAYVFERSGTTWSQQTYIKASNPGFDFFGSSVSLIGRTLAIGAPLEDSDSAGVNGPQGDAENGNYGAVYLFRNNGGWKQSAYVKASNPGIGDLFFTTALTASTLVVGATGESSAATGVDGDQHNDDARSAGAVYAFDIGCLTIDFETTGDLGTPLLNGQQIETELASMALVSSTGPNAGVAIFDSTPGGPNDPSQDTDLLVGTGNVLILQTENAPPSGGVFPSPNDDENGGSIFFHLVGAREVGSVRLIDVDASDQAWAVELTDTADRRRTYTVPAGWTGDVNAAGPGHAVLDLTTLAPQPGFASVATALEDPGFDPFACVRVEVFVAGTGAVDDLELCPGEAQSQAQAAVEPRNGSGANPDILSACSLPVLGGTFTVQLDCSTTGRGLAILEVRRSSTAGDATVNGEPLVAGALVYRTIKAHAGGVSTLAWAVPHDLTLVGTSVHAQGLCRAGRSAAAGKLRRATGRLSNALDLVLGF